MPLHQLFIEGPIEKFTAEVIADIYAAAGRGGLSIVVKEYP